MKDFWDYVNQDKSTGDTSLNRMRLASFPTPLSKKKSSIISTHWSLKEDPLLTCKIGSKKPISLCFSQIFSPQKGLLHSTISHF